MLFAKRHGANVLLGIVLLAFAAETNAEDWPCWRGPRLDGTSHERNLPLDWNLGSNLLWTVAIPGVGHASPIVFGDHIFITSALLDSGQRLLLCLDRASGRALWQQTVLAAPLEHKHSLNSFASSTPATDGTSVFVAFLDRDRMFVAAYDFAGTRQWAVRPGPFASMHGFCSSPILYHDKVILNGDHDGDSYLVALSRADGRVLWKTPRENHTRSYCAPLIGSFAGRAQMVLSGDKCVASYDPDTGARLWIIDGPTEQFVASPVYSQACGLIFITGGFPDHHILAIRPDGSGNVSQTHIAWRTTQGAAYVPSPIVEGRYFLVVSDSGVAHCFEAATGNLLWKERTGEQHASAVSAEGLVFLLNDKGVMNIIKPGPQFELVAQNQIPERCFASPAISHGEILLRGQEHLYCFGPSSTNGRAAIELPSRNR